MLYPHQWYHEDREYQDDVYHKLIRNHQGNFLVHREVSELQYLHHMLDRYGVSIGPLGVQFLSDEAYDSICDLYAEKDMLILPE